MTQNADLSSHNGLRGFAAVWVMVFHTLIFSKRPIDLQGSSLMPLFFMLSGFTLVDLDSRYVSSLLGNYLWRSQEIPFLLL
jgi:peptidoglycan/LPS O-acetylase OafA/YrhL